MDFCFKLPKAHSPIFPDECFICGNGASKNFKIRRFQIKEFYIIYISYRTASIEVPVCSKHYRKLLILKTGTWLFILLGIIFSLIIQNGSIYLLFGILASTLCCVIYLRMKNNFRIFSIDSNSWTIYSSKNEVYLKKLCELNNAEVFVRDFWTGTDY